MGDCIKEVTCSRCGHTWYANLTALLQEGYEVYRGPAQAEKRVDVAAPCPICGTRRILTLRAEEAERCLNPRS